MKLEVHIEGEACTPMDVEISVSLTVFRGYRLEVPLRLFGHISCATNKEPRNLMMQLRQVP